jgi:integrase
MAGTVPGHKEDGMARNTRSSALESRSSRLKLPKRGKPVWVRIDRGLSLGYRRIETAGPWIVRKATGNGGNWIKNFATADDYEESNGDDVLSFFEAQAIARTIAKDGETSGGLITVSAAIDRYRDDLKARGGREYNARFARIHLTPTLLQKPVSLLTVGELKHWRDGLLAGRTRATVNRIVAVLAAALELAANTDPRITARPWKVGLKKLRGANANNARNVVLSESEVRTLVAKAYEQSPELGRLVEVMAVTGARLSQLGRLVVADLLDDALHMPSSLKGKGMRRIDRVVVPVPDALVAKLRQAVDGLSPDAPLLPQSDGTPWGNNDLRRPFQEIVAQSGLASVTTSYALRHTLITRLLVRGIPIRTVARLCDTSVPMIEATYSRHINDHSNVRHTLLDLSSPTETKVVPIRGAKG